MLFPYLISPRPLLLFSLPSYLVASISSPFLSVPPSKQLPFLNAKSRYGSDPFRVCHTVPGLCVGTLFLSLPSQPPLRALSPSHLEEKITTFPFSSYWFVSPIFFFFFISGGAIFSFPPAHKPFFDLFLPVGANRFFFPLMLESLFSWTRGILSFLSSSNLPPFFTSFHECDLTPIFRKILSSEIATLP